MKRALKTILLALLAPTALTAAPVSAERAVEAASAWVRRERGRPDSHRQPSKRGRRQMAPRGDPTGRIRTCSVGGTNLFHLVSLDGGGFVAVSADDSHHPIMGFSPSGELPDEDMNNPFWSLAGADAMARRGIGGRGQHGRRGGSSGGRSATLRFSDSTAASGARTRPMAAASGSAGTTVKSETGIEDVRVSPLVQSKWSQSTLNDLAGGKPLYNLYTPNNWPCGCVATAMAQLMRYHRYPTSSVTAREFTCYTNGIDVALTMKGGTYDWDSMPLVPSSSITDAQREAIGRICYDAGVAARMRYYDGGSTAFTAFVFDPFKNVFGYASAHSYFEDDNSSLAADSIENGILANLDAGCPVLLGIFKIAGESAINGHAIVADGYGYLDGTLYCHLNMGWSGSSDYWYALPEIKTDTYTTSGKYEANAIVEIVYNIFPDSTGELITGRVTDTDGNPVEGAEISASISNTRSFGKTATANASATTSASGTYAIFAPAGRSSTARLTVSCRGATTNITAYAKASRSPSSVDFATGGCSWTGSLSIGNSWGNDIVLDIPTPFKFILR